MAPNRDSAYGIDTIVNTFSKVDLADALYSALMQSGKIAEDDSSMAKEIIIGAFINAELDCLGQRMKKVNVQ